MKVHKELFFSLVVTILIIIVMVFLVPPRYSLRDDGFLLFLVIVTLFSSSIYLIGIYKITRSWLSFFSLFLLGYVIVNYQVILLSICGIEPSKPSFIWINPLVVNYSTWLSSIAINSFILGSILYFINKAKNTVQVKYEKFQVNLKAYDYFLIVALGTFGLLVGKEFLSGRYDGGSNWGAGASYVFIILRCSVILRIIYFFKLRNEKSNKRESLYSALQHNKIFALVYLVYVGLFLQSGDRGPMIEILVVTLISYSMFYKSISLGKLILIGSIGIVLMTLVRLGRTSFDNVEGNILERGINNFQNSESDSFLFTDELASSVRILYRAVDVVPSKHDYLYGTTMVFDAIAGIPFASRLLFSSIEVPVMYRSSTYFFTVMGQGNFYTYGEGSQFVGDIYINLGVYGVIFLMFLFGAFISFIFNSHRENKNFILVIFYISICGAAIYMNRSVFFFPFQIAIYLYVLHLVFSKKILS